MRILLSSNFYKKIAYVLIAVIVFLAIMVTITRLLTPALNSHRQEVETWSSAFLNRPVKIQQLHVSWYRYQPEVTLSQVTILSKDTQLPVLQIQEVGISFSLIKSLWKREFIADRIRIAGTDINVYQNKNGDFNVQGFPVIAGFSGEPFQQESKLVDAMSWLSQKPHISLHNIDVRYTGWKGEKRFLTLYDLNLKNAGNQHTISGKAILHQSVPTEMTVGIRWIGHEFDLKTINANIYLYISGLSLSQWLQAYSWQGWQIKQGIGSAKVWLTWHDGAFQKAQTTFQLYAVDLFAEADQSIHQLNRLSGHIGWRRQGDLHIVAGDDLLIDLPGKFWPVNHFHAEFQQQTTDQASTDKKWVLKILNIGYLDLSDVQSFLLPFKNALSAELQKLIGGLKPSGGIENLAMTFSPSGEYQKTEVKLNLADVNFLSYQGIPAVKNLSGTLKWDGEKGKFLLNSDRIEINDQTHFFSPMIFDQLLGEIDWKHDDKNTSTWLIDILSLQVLNNDGAANLKGTLILPQTEAASLDLNAHFTLHKVKNINRYLPLRSFDTDLVTWLQHAFLSGEVTSGEAIIKGRTSDFPFDKENGTFFVSGKIDNLDLHYAPSWPNLKNINATLTFSGRQMIAEINEARLMDIPIKKVRGVIPYLGEDHPQILEIKSESITSDFSKALKFVQSSPLKKTIGKMFADVDLEGALELDLGLTVPLANLDAIAVSVDITMHDAHMLVVPWRLELSHLNGKLHATEKNAEADRIQGELFDHPFQLSLSTLKQANHASIIRAHFATQVEMNDLENWLALPITKTVQGTTDVTGTVDLSLDQPVVVGLQSKLVGLTINLPDQYAKKAEVSRDFSTTVFIANHQPLRIKFNYGSEVGAALVLNRQGKHFNWVSAVLSLGNLQTPEWAKTPGLYIVGQFDELNWNSVKHYLSQSSDNLLPMPLRQIDVQTKILSILGQQLSKVRLQLMPGEGEWKVDISSPEVQGQINVPIPFNSEGEVNAQFQRINLNTPKVINKAVKQSDPLFDVKSLPSISFVANNVSYNRIPLGKVIFKTAPSSEGLVIQSLRLTSPRLDLQASGTWQAANITQLQGVATSSQVSELINSLGVNASNLIFSNGKLTFALAWNDAPYAPSLSGLTGKVNLELGKGRIVDVGQTNGAKMDLGRMLSIFSLQTIPRRLSFDFSDVFQKGYSFDFVKGDFTFQDNSAYTHNLRFDGPVARVDIDGRIGLKNKDYDFILNVTPYVTSSIPVAATILTGNPVVGLAAMAVNTVISSGVSKVTTYYYAVKGPWDNPSWQSISAPKTR